MKRLATYLMISLLSFSVHAQDPHFSQFFNNPIYNNPSFTGHGIDYVRISGLYRTQWSNAVNYSTQSFSVDKAVERFGFGAYFMHQGTGEAGIKQTNIQGTFGYRQPIGKNILGFGFQVGLIQKSFDPSKMSFDNQYSPDGSFDPNLNSGEIFSSLKTNRPDLNAGFLYEHGSLDESRKIKPYVGAALHHIIEPKETFIIDQNILPSKLNLQVGASIRVNEQTKLSPMLMYTSQGPFAETVGGVLADFKMNNENVLQFGTFYRNEGAIVLHTGFQVKRMLLGLSYDITTSQLASAASPGSFELSVSVLPIGPKKNNKKDGKESIVFSDKDLDGVIDAEDQCPDVFGEASNNGCPIQKNVSKTGDMDGDGIMDANDLCPDEAGPAETKGCPVSDIDADGDGIPNKIDQCIYVKGTAATMGCPDTDKDGISDFEDACPYIKGSKEFNGCPDPNAKPKEKQIRMGNIEFETDKADVRTMHFDLLEQTLDSLYSDKNTVMILSGHTDDEGDEAYNMILSQKRADAIKTYLMKQGIEESRIRTIAFGELVPVVDNMNQDIKGKNRRVELNIIRTLR
ncbi:MAG TPA: PorP/SprF family type IX secretion system membrane protein [Bacteroidia bacterium]|nr:PorP/SprF family type IX secretion system membrane protein [Bacteroidia bacterium]HNT79348.1 PorP/SprF family type IX secretion system membrane protein [Bacteroidia bacterium]